MNNYLLVPLKLDALLLEEPMTVMGPKADFSQLPWTNGQQDYNADVPFLASSILATPFQNLDYTLNKGVHLHWTLPRALRTSSGDTVGFRAAPNRWLITRNGDKTAQWIVESDYLATEQKDELFNEGAVTIPFFKDLTSQLPTQPYKFLGRQLPKSNWQESGNKDWKNAFGDFTAIGYGEPSFSTFYPNCRSAFGFFDSEGGSKNLEGPITYDVLGWYSDSDDDILRQVTNELDLAVGSPKGHALLIDKLFDNNGDCPAWYSTLVKDAGSNAGWPTGASNQASEYKVIRDRIKSTNPEWLGVLLQLSEAAKTQFYFYGFEKIISWKGNPDTTNPTPQYPTQSLYYGTIEVSKDHQSSTPTFEQVAVGHTGAEALSAHLAASMPATFSEKTKTVIEDQLEAILLGSKLLDNKVDVGPNFQEARHQKGFIGEEAGILWTVRKIKTTGIDQDESDTHDATTLPDEVLTDLDSLNLLQQEYDRAVQNLDIRNFEVYASWCKYMQSSYPPLGDKENYPDIDEIESLVEYQLAKLELLKAQTGQLDVSRSDEKVEIEANGLDSSLAKKIVQAHSNLESGLPTPPEGYTWQLDYVPGPRYYAPRDPVVLLAANSSTQHPDTDSELQCLYSEKAATGSDTIPEISNVTFPKKPNAFESAQGAWNPQLLEWLTEFFPVDSQSNTSSASGKYQETYIGSNFELEEDRFDFTQQDNLTENAIESRGSTYTSTRVGDRMRSALKAFILRQYSDAIEDADLTGTSDQLIQKIWGSPTSKYKNEKQDFTNAGYTAVQAYAFLADKLLISQSLGGFHQALLQRDHNLRMPIADPLGFIDNQEITAKVASALEGIHPPAPHPEDLFVPVRAGALRLVELRLTDHFGRPVNANIENVITTDQLEVSREPGWSWLGPRFAQAARLNFRWLAAKAGPEMETNNHPGSTPVCGWILPNYLDHSLVFYDADGEGLGSFSSGGTWQPTPASVNSVTADDIDQANPKNLNSYLLRVLLYVKNKTVSDSGFVENLISAVQGAQENIYPESYAGHDALSILIGKPMAIVRASLNLETKSGVLSDQGWNPLRLEVQSAVDSTDNYENIEFPIRLGEYRQLNDGLVGYWVEENGELDQGVFYVSDSIAASCPNPQGSLPSTLDDTQISAIQILLQENKGLVKRQDFALAMSNGGQVFDQLLKSNFLVRTTPLDSSIDYYSDAGLITQTITSAPAKVTMLMDPHGVIHATSGILPVKTVQIPTDQYSSALRKIAVTFLTSPIITPKNVIKVDLPSEKGYKWSWLEKRKKSGTTDWYKIPDKQTISQTSFAGAWETYVSSVGKDAMPTELQGQDPWGELQSKNWVQPMPENESLFVVTSENDNTRQALVTWKDYEKEIQLIINQNSTGVESYDPDARFYKRQEIKEGWLQLTHEDQKTKTD